MVELTLKLMCQVYLCTTCKSITSLARDCDTSSGSQVFCVPGSSFSAVPFSLGSSTYQSAH